MLYRKIIIVLFFALNFVYCKAQSLPSHEGERVRYGVMINIKDAYISGICSMLYESGTLKASIVNEFGFSAMDFEYDKAKDKVKLISVVGNLDHWYIKRVLKKDLKALLHNIENGVYNYEDKKYKITYTFSNYSSEIDNNADKTAASKDQ